MKNLKHRLIVYLKPRVSPTRKSQTRQATPNWVSQITLNLVRLRLVQELREAGVDQIQQVLKSNALDSIFTLIDLRDDTQAPKAVRQSRRRQFIGQVLR